VISLIGRQLEALGHTVEWSNEGLYTAPGTCNILVEGFSEPHIDYMRQCKEAGGRIIIIATEEPTPTGFNHGIIEDMKRRQAIFPEAAKYADAIWHLVPGCTDWYGQFGAPAAFLDLGYSPKMVRSVDVQLDHDFGFFGSITPRRQKIMQKFADSGLKVRQIQFGSCAARDYEMSRCRVILQIRSHEQMGLISNSRCCTALHLGRPVIAEPHANPGKWTEIIEFAPIEFYMQRAVFMRKNWRDAYKAQFNKFKALLSPENCVGRTIENTMPDIIQKMAA
jgi:hypothetical protein